MNLNLKSKSMQSSTVHTNMPFAGNYGVELRFQHSTYSENLNSEGSRGYGRIRRLFPSLLSMEAVRLFQGRLPTVLRGILACFH